MYRYTYTDAFLPNVSLLEKLVCFWKLNAVKYKDGVLEWDIKVCQKVNLEIACLEIKMATGLFVMALRQYNILTIFRLGDILDGR